MGCSSPILNDNPLVYTTYNRDRIRNVHTYIFTQSFWTGTKVIRRKHIVQPTGFGACSSTCCQWDGEVVPAPWERWNPHPPVRVQKLCVNPFLWYNICSRGVFIGNSKLRNFVIVAIECFFATIDRCSVTTGINRWSMMIYCSLQVNFERTKPNGRIQRYGASIFGDIIIKVFKSINKEQQVFRRLQYIARFVVPSVLIASRTGFLQFLLQTF